LKPGVPAHGNDSSREDSIFQKAGRRRGKVDYGRRVDLLPYGREKRVTRSSLGRRMGGSRGKEGRSTRGKRKGKLGKSGG